MALVAIAVRAAVTMLQLAAVAGLLQRISWRLLLCSLFLRNYTRAFRRCRVLGFQLVK